MKKQQKISKIRNKSGSKIQGRDNKKRKSSRAKGVTGRTIGARCISQLTLAMRRWKDVVTNYKRQSARITDNKKKGGNKAGKKGLFAPIANKLVSFGGGC